VSSVVWLRLKKQIAIQRLELRKTIEFHYELLDKSRDQTSLASNCRQQPLFFTLCILASRISFVVFPLSSTAGRLKAMTGIERFCTA